VSDASDEAWNQASRSAQQTSASSGIAPSFSLSASGSAPSSSTDLAALAAAVAGLSDERALKKQQDALSAAVAKETKKAVEAEVRRTLEAKSFKDDVAAAIAQSVQAELLTVVAAKVKDTVRETVKSSLASAFRTSFESSLLPAFQAGTDRMFMQLQASFEQGLEGLVEQDRERAEETRATAQLVALLKDEVSALRAVVSSLEARLAAGGAGAAAAPAAVQDPIELLQRGMIEPALEAALEHKDTEVLVRVLGQLSPSQVTDKCSVLVLLCTTQQLAVDLAATVEPVEVRCHSLPPLHSKTPNPNPNPLTTNNNRASPSAWSGSSPWCCTSSSPPAPPPTPPPPSTSSSCWAACTRASRPHRPARRTRRCSRIS